MSYSKHAEKNKIDLLVSPYRRNGKWHSWRGYIAGYPRKYFTHPDTKDGYEAAVLDFLKWKQGLNDQRLWVPELKHHLQLFQQVENWWSVNGISNDELDASKNVTEFIKWIKEQIESDSQAPPIDFDLTKAFLIEFVDGMIDDHYQQQPVKALNQKFGSIGYQLNGKWKERLQSIVPDGNKIPQTIEYWHAQYVAAQKEKAELNKISFYTFKDSKTKSAFFAERYPTLSVKKLTEETWRGYFNFLKTLKGKTGEAAKGRTKESYLKAAKTFLNWCKRQKGKCEIVLPENLDDPDLSFVDTDDETPVGERLKELWTLEEIKTVLDSNEKYFKAFVLLCLNAGCLEEDLHVLQHNQLTDNRLIYKRRKSRKKKHVPVVNYYLWKETIDALNEIKTDPKKFSELLHTARGVRIKSANNNNLSRGWGKVRARLGLRPELNMRKLRNTATTILKHSDNFRDLSKHYLGHAVTVEDRHYNIIDGQIFKPFDDALKYMGEKLGIRI